jgi:hypothetical protein
MGSGSGGGLSRRRFGVALFAISGLVLAQSVVHLELVLGAGRIDTFVDLDRSNGLPDIISTVALGSAAAGALAVAFRESGSRRAGGVALAAVLGALTLADLVHDGAHPSSAAGRTVIVVVLAAGVLLALGAGSFSGRAQGMLLVAVAFLIASFLTTGLDRFDAERFERERGDPVAEYEIVAKEGLELLGWSLIALALWDEALRRPAPHARLTAPASRARARSRRRAA